MGFNISDIIDRWEKDEPVYKKIGELVQKKLKERIFEEGIYSEVSSRTKDVISLLKKIKNRNIASEYKYEDLTDKLGVRVICNYKEDIKIVDEVINKFFDVEKFEDKAEKLENKVFEYTSYHYDVEMKDVEFKGYVFELQLRTINQHAWACTAHELSYKQDVALPYKLSRKVFRLSALYELADDELSIINTFVNSHPDFPIFNIYRAIEKHFYKLAKTQFNKDHTIFILRMLCEFVELPEAIVREFEKFIDSNSKKIKNIFEEYNVRIEYSIILLQPEIIFTWFLLEKMEFQLRDFWRQNLDESDLEIIENAWGTLEE